MEVINRVKVEILGATYTIKGSEEEDYIRKLADYVDKRLREISEKTSTVSPNKVAILGALTIADELFKTKQDLERRIDALISKISAISDSKTRS
jgi:cell division protein ZapA